MRVETYIESLQNEGLGIEQEFTINRGDRFISIEVTDNIAINLYLDNCKEVHALTVYSFVGIEDDLHYTDTLMVIEAVSRLILNIGRRDRKTLYEQVIGTERKSVVITPDHKVFTDIKDNIFEFSVVENVN